MFDLHDTTMVTQPLSFSYDYLTTIDQLWPLIFKWLVIVTCLPWTTIISYHIWSTQSLDDCCLEIVAWALLPVQYCLIMATHMTLPNYNKQKSVTHSPSLNYNNPIINVWLYSSDHSRPTIIYLSSFNQPQCLTMFS